MEMDGNGLNLLDWRGRGRRRCRISRDCPWKLFESHEISFQNVWNIWCMFHKINTLYIVLHLCVEVWTIHYSVWNVVDIAEIGPSSCWEVWRSLHAASWEFLQRFSFEIIETLRADSKLRKQVEVVVFFSWRGYFRPCLFMVRGFLDFDLKYHAVDGWLLILSISSRLCFTLSFCTLHNIWTSMIYEYIIFLSFSQHETNGIMQMELV